jgi:hypothetical protein
MSLAPKKSMRPKPNPKNADKPMRPKRNPMYDMNSPKSVADRSTREMKKGGMVEGSAKDMREDKAKAKKAGMTMAEWEKSAADKKHDAPKKMAAGGKLKMVEKDGKKVPSYAADGVGKMAMGGMTKMAAGGSVRGTGCAVRGKNFSGTY